MLYYGKKKKKQKDEEEENSEDTHASVVELLQSLDADTPEKRSIMFVGEVNEEKSADLISALLVLSQDKKPDQKRAEDIKLSLVKLQ